jgi:V/A-type H+/Na+-transporting ATPase subunit K
MLLVVAVIVGLMPIILAVLFFNRDRIADPVKATHNFVLGFHGFNIIVGLMAAGIVAVWLFSPTSVAAAGLNQTQPAGDIYKTLAAAISTGLACIGAGIAVGGSGAAAIGATAEKPETFGRSLIFVGLSEGIAIYGLVISFIILFVKL